MYESMIVFQKTLTCYLPEQPVMVTGTGSTVKEGNTTYKNIFTLHMKWYTTRRTCVFYNHMMKKLH